MLSHPAPRLGKNTSEQEPRCTELAPADGGEHDALSTRPRGRVLDRSLGDFNYSGRTKHH